MRGGDRHVRSLRPGGDGCECRCGKKHRVDGPAKARSATTNSSFARTYIGVHARCRQRPPRLWTRQHTAGRWRPSVSGLSEANSLTLSLSLPPQNRSWRCESVPRSATHSVVSFASSTFVSDLALNRQVGDVPFSLTPPWRLRIEWRRSTRVELCRSTRIDLASKDRITY